VVFFLLLCYLKIYPKEKFKMLKFRQLKKKVRRQFQFIFPYKYNPKRYSDTFLCKTPILDDSSVNEVPEVIYCFWTGTNEMSENRKRAVESLQKVSEVDVKLIDPTNLQNYILPEYPLHSAYEYLSLVHKADYLRCYFMHHHGGGYSDVKICVNSWKDSFHRLNKSDKQILGYSEIGYRAVAQLEGKLGKDLRRYFLTVIGNCAYICRPNSSFTREWYAELHERLDLHLSKLKLNPGNVWGDNEGYPIPWTGILGDIFHPLCLKYSKHMIVCEKIKPDFNNYR